MIIAGILHPVLALLLAPLLMGVINRTKAVFAGRKGQPLLQGYFDILKLFRKGVVYSNATTWVFRSGPVVGFAVVLIILAMLPFAGLPSVFSFQGDVLLVVYLLGVMRFFTVIAAMDTASSFEGMGASREVKFAALAEPALLLAFAVLVRMTGNGALAGILGGVEPITWRHGAPSLILVLCSLFIILLTENSRIPVDDPNTHLELTMIHEVMVLDHSGVDFGFIQYASALKMWIFAMFMVNVAVPVHTGSFLVDGAAVLAGLLLVGIAVGTVESCMARLSMKRVPQLLAGALSLSLVGFLLL